MDYKNILLLIIIALLLVSQFSCYKMKKQLDKEKIDYTEIIDSLEQVKSKIIYTKDEIIVSESISSGVNQLKENLQKWNGY